MRNETGRSLTEVLGTLAIMGILSMAGVWAYHVAMDKLKANTLINEAQKRAVMVAGQINMQGRSDPTLSEFNDNTFGGGTFGTQVTVNGLYKQFGIQVSGVSKRVCQNILNSIDEGTSIRRLTTSENPRTPLTNCADTNTFLMIYNNDLSTASGDTQYCQTDSSCQTVCGTCNLTTHLCENDCDIPEIAGGCDFDSECNADNKCMICNAETRQCEDGCQHVEYLESTGTQYIDTGIVANGLLNTKIKFSFTGNSIAKNMTPIGAGTTSPNHRYWINYDGKFEIGYGSWQAVTPKLVTQPYDINEVNFNYMSPGDDKHYFDFNGTINSVTGDPVSNIPLTLFARNSDGIYYSPVRIFYVKMLNGITLIRDFVPVHAPFQPVGKQNCMFDKVSKGLFCNATNGDDFIVPDTP